MGVLDFSNLVGLIPSYRLKVWLVRGVVRGLAETGNVDEAVRVISALPDAAWRWEILSELASFLSENGDYEGPLKIFMGAKDNDIVLDYLLDVRNCVENNVEKVLDSFNISGERVRRAVSRLGNYRLLDWFGFLTKAGRVDEALEASRRFEEDHYRSEGLLRVAVALAEMGNERYKEVLNEALTVAETISVSDYEEIIAGAAVDFASVGKGSEAIDLTLNILGDYEFADTLIACIPYFEDKNLEYAVKEILEIIDELPVYEKYEILTRLFSTVILLPKLDKSIVERTIEKAEYETLKSSMKFIYASKLLEKGDEEGRKLYEEVMKKLREFTGENRFHLAYSLVNFVTRDYVNDFLKYVKEIPDIREQAEILSKISMSQISRGEFDDALKTVKSITLSDESSSPLFSLVKQLSEKDFERALNIAREIPVKHWREAAFSTLFAKALEKGEFREDLFKKILAGQVRGNEGDVITIFWPAIISLAKAGRKELADIVKLLLDLDNLKTLKNTLTLLAGGNLEGALKAAREGLGFAKPLALSAVAVKAYKSKKPFSPKKLLEEAMREVKKIKVLFELDTAYNIIASAMMVTGKVEDAINLIVDKVRLEAQEAAISNLLLLMPTVGRVDNLIRLTQRLADVMYLDLLRILVHTFEEGCISEFEKLVDSLISYDSSLLQDLIDYFIAVQNVGWAQRLIDKEEEAEDRLYDYSDLGFMFSIMGDVEQAKKVFEKAVEEIKKIREEQSDVSYEEFYLMRSVLVSADKTCVDFVKDHLEPDKGELLSKLFEAYRHASSGNVENAQKIFQDIIDKNPNLEDALASMVAVAGRAGGKASAVLLKMLETKIKGLLDEDEVTSVMIDFLLAGGDPETMVKMVEKNWGRSSEILLKIAPYLAIAGKVETTIKIIESANQHDKHHIIRENARQIARYNLEKALELVENLPVYFKDTALARITEELTRRGRIEDALNITSKIVHSEDYIQALTNILLIFIEETAKVTTNKQKTSTQ